MQFETWSYRFADQVLNSKLALKNELESVIHGVQLPTGTYLRPELNRRFEKVQRCLPHFKTAIQVPIWLVGFPPS
jgi:hypothetical protein